MTSEKLFCILLPSVSLHVIKYINNLDINLSKKIGKQVLSYTAFYLEDDDDKPVIFNEETTTFTCQSVEN